MRAWIYQDDKQVKKHGAAKASYYVGWLDPGGKRCCKSCGAGAIGKNAAQKFQRKVEAQLLTGTYEDNTKRTWEQFRHEYEAKIAEGMGPSTRRLTLDVISHFERIIKPNKSSAIKTQTIDHYRAGRRSEPGK